ncbi:hypothetical protein TrVFT333_005157 [Trichoderma virens FT-333]|nr:hypothetical protein TrVFT333_005157 [Trichoderma virens FT-333]
MRTTNARRGRLSFRPFYTTVLLLSLLAAYSFLAHTQHHHGDAHGDAHGELGLFKRSDEEPECRQVHTAKDQCAFVREYCIDEDAGLLPYLELYYCRLGKAQPVAFVLLVTWLGLLFTTIGIAASDFFSVNLSTIATILGLSESLAGVTFLAFGNGSPDVFSTFAAMGSNSASMAVGELIGAASFITGVVAGSMALVREFRVDRRTYARDICFFIVAISFTMGFLADGELRFWECCAMIGYYVLYVVTVVGCHWYTTRRKRRLRREGEARSHFYGLTGHSGDELAGEPYRDEPDDASEEPSRRAPSTIGESVLSALERGPVIEVDGQSAETPGSFDSEETDEDHERMVVAEVTRSMRVLRPQGGRRNTLTPIRPSLIGALEFRSALAHLQRESNLQLSPIPARSYSEHHISRGRRRGSTSAVSDMLPPAAQGDVSPYDAAAADGRERARSHGTAPASAAVPHDLLDVVRERSDSSLLSPAASQRTASPAPSYQIGGKLAPPPVDLPGTVADSPMPISPNTQPEQAGFSMLPASTTVRESPFAALGSAEAMLRPTPLLALPNEDTLVISPRTQEPGMPKPLSEVRSISRGSEEKLGWNRWLVCLQLFMGPLFAVVILWANISEDWERPGAMLVRMILWTLLGSFILLGALLLLTSEEKRPEYHFLFCFLGFIISIAWISTVAGEVVGVLKTFGVVLGISEALLGLTIFAAGNSVGDLVADITVARLGYPVMALSACFGGPMLNILLGIGVGDRGTLMISSITLLVILVGLLIAVPLNKWILSRRIGWALIAIWVASTVANVVVELTGVIGDIS